MSESTGKGPTCNIRGCASQPTAIFDAAPERGPPIEFAVCAFHLQTLHAGERWTVGDDYTELILGEHAPPEVLDFEVSTRIGEPVVELSLGYGGIESQRLSLRIDPGMMHQLCHWVAGGEHPDAFGGGGED